MAALLKNTESGNIPSRVGLNRVTPFGLAERRSFPFHRRERAV